MAGCALSAAVTLAAAPVCAQTRGPAVDFSIRPGAFLPATNLVESVEYFVPVTLDAAFALSADIALRSTSGLDFEWQVVHVPTRIRFEVVGQNGEVFRTPHVEDMRVWLVSGNLRWRFAQMPRAQPFLIGGLGVTRWDSDVLQDDGSATDFTVNAGAGAYVGLGGPLSLRLEGRAYLSWFTPQDFDPSVNDKSDRFQAHFTLGVGLTMRSPAMQ